MRKSRFSESEIVAILKEADAGMAVKDVCRKHGISQATYYNWKKKFAGMGSAEVRRLKQLEDENRRLKGVVADLTLDKEMLQEVLRKKL